MHAPERIPRELPIRELSPQETKAITDVVFAPSRPRRSDLLVIFGAPASSGRWTAAAQLLHDGFAPQAVATGGAPYQDGSAASEAAGIRSELIAAGVAASAILVEERSTNTLENVLFTIELLHALKARPKSLVFYCKSHHSGRVWRTLSKHLPEVRLSCATYDAAYGATSVPAESWMRSEVAVRRVLAEYERIRVYADRGDIAP
ncbi:YdcF family protein [Ramlibacter sp.]